ncbi:MAG TPA: GAF and ANTAR domain-containing protein [Acidimicrobiia bacterium]
MTAGAQGDGGSTREALLAQTFVDVADTLVADFDIVDFLTVLTNRCVELFDLSESGLLLADALGHVRVVASSSHRMELLELFELQYEEGPCLDCYRGGDPVRCDDLRDATDRWPRFAREALAVGCTSVYAVPMRLRHQTIGSLNLLRAQPSPLADADLAAAQALADVATIGILQYRATEEQRVLAQQLQHALDSRIAVEQAKGVLAEHGHLRMEAAYSALRRYARDHNQRLADVACAVVDRTLPADALMLRRDNS